MYYLRPILRSKRFFLSLYMFYLSIVCVFDAFGRIVCKGCKVYILEEHIYKEI
jgi:hypothetical protein